MKQNLSQKGPSVSEQQAKTGERPLLIFGSASLNSSPCFSFIHLHLEKKSGGEADPFPLKGREGLISNCGLTSACGLVLEAFPKPQARRRCESCLPTQEKEHNQRPPSALSQGSEVPFLDVLGGSELVNQSPQH